MSKFMRVKLDILVDTETFHMKEFNKLSKMVGKISGVLYIDGETKLNPDISYRDQDVLMHYKGYKEEDFI